MADARTQHLLARSVRKLAVDIVRDTSVKRLRDADTVLAEREEQVQLAVSGLATAAPGWAVIAVPFQQVFTTSTERRQSQLDRPHTWFGYEMVSLSDAETDAPSAGGVMLAAHVSSWSMQDGINITGAKVAVSAFAPVRSFNFRAVVHMTFQGYGVPRDPEPDMEP